MHVVIATTEADAFKQLSMKADRHGKNWLQNWLGIYIHWKIKTIKLSDKVITPHTAMYIY